MSHGKSSFKDIFFEFSCNKYSNSPYISATDKEPLFFYSTRDTFIFVVVNAVTTNEMVVKFGAPKIPPKSLTFLSLSLFTIAYVINNGFGLLVAVARRNPDTIGQRRLLIWPATCSARSAHEHVLSRQNTLHRQFHLSFS